MKPGQLIFRVLIGGCSVLAVVAVLLVLGVGQEIDPLDPEVRELGNGDEALAELDQFQLRPLGEYGVIVEYPLFNDDRLPRPPSDEPDPGPGPGGGEPEPVALDVAVNGIIITESVKVALVKDKKTKEVYRLKEGMPMEGEMGQWILTSIEPRKLTFEGGGDGPAEVELKVHKKELKGGGPAPKAVTSRPGARPSTEALAAAAQNKKDGNDKPDTPDENASDEERAAKAEEIRRRVAERRAQLRAEAARRRGEQDENKDR